MIQFILTEQTKTISNRQALGWYLSLPLSKFMTVDAIKSLVVRRFHNQNQYDIDINIFNKYS